MSTVNQQTLAESGTEGRPPILEKGSYVPWASRFFRFLDNKKEEGELMRDRYYADIKVMNYILQGIPNDIYNFVDACEDAQGMWQRVKRLMQVIIEQRVKVNQKARFLELKRRNYEDTILKTNTPYPSRKIRISKKNLMMRLMREPVRNILEFHERSILSKNKGLVAETFDWDEEEVYDDEDMTQVTVLIALADIGKNHARNAKLYVVTFQIQNTKLIKINHALQEQLKEERKLNEKWLNISNKIPKSKDWVERFNLDSKLPNFNIGRILTPESQTVNEYLKLTKATTNIESSKGEDHRTSDHKMYVASLKNSENYKAQPYQYALPSKQILKARAKPFPPCTNCGFNDH
ncbi:hypothetical protein Tco_0006636 [Tanacetum coccineum]